jgi:hypothetical protein
MKAIDSRIRRLQDRLCPDHGQEQRFWVTILPGQKFALDRDRCIEILGECGFLPTVRFVVLNFMNIPYGLTAKELEQYLRKNGAQICGFGRAQRPSVPNGASQLVDSSWSSQAQISADWGR